MDWDLQEKLVEAFYELGTIKCMFFLAIYSRINGSAVCLFGSQFNAFRKLVCTYWNKFERICLQITTSFSR